MSPRRTSARVPFVSCFSLNSTRILLLLLATAFAHPAWAKDGTQKTNETNKPMPVSLGASIEAPSDIAYPGLIELQVDATDLNHRIFRVHESIPVAHPGNLTLLFPQWTPGDHSPNGPLDKLAGLIISERGHRVSWVRDTVAMYAFHVQVPDGATTLDLTFEYLASLGPTTGPMLINQNMLDLQWQSVVLYPAGYFSRDIRFHPRVTLPAAWAFYSALEGGQRLGNVVTFAPVTLETLVDAPVMAGRYTRTAILSNDPVRVSLDVAADSEAALAQFDIAAASMKCLQRTTTQFFSARHYAHYDHMLWLSDNFGPVYYEHHASGENSRPGNLLAGGNGPTPDISFMEHGFVHSWNGMYRRPAEMWTPNLNWPEQDSMFWVFEGLTEYWSHVLAVRAGVTTRQDFLEHIAQLAASTGDEDGAQWRTLQDVSNSPIFAFRKQVAWPTWQRGMYDAYDQGELIWFGVDMLLRQHSDGKRSLDCFARSFFGTENGRVDTRTYTYADMINALNRIDSYDWNTYFQLRLQEYGTEKSLDGIGTAGYHLTFMNEPVSAEQANNFLDLAYSIGMQVGHGGRLLAVHWQGAAYMAGLTPGNTITAVNGAPYAADLLQSAVEKGGSIRLTVAAGGVISGSGQPGSNTHDVTLTWRGGLRRPKLARQFDKPDLIQSLLMES